MTADPKTARTIRDIGPGDHCCTLYENAEERLAILAPFVDAGLREGDRLLVLGEPALSDSLLSLLAGSGVDVRGAVAAGRIRAVSPGDAYLHEGAFRPDRMAAFLAGEAAAAREAGCRALRVAGDRDWVRRDVPGSERLLEYEALLNRVLAERMCTVLCPYDRRRFDPAELLNVLTAHPSVVIGNGVFENFHFVPPDSFRGHDFLSRMLGQLMENLSGRERVKAAEAAAARLTLAVEQVGETIVITDTEGTILYVNPAFERITGYARGEVIGWNPRILKSGVHGPAFYREMWDTLRRGDTWSGFFVNRRKDGATYEEKAVISPIRDPSGRIINYVAVKRDVTHERRMEEQLRQAHKMEAVGRLAGGIAHDFNNLLTAVTGYGELLLEKLPPEEPMRREVEEIVRAGERATTLTRQLLAFSRKQVLQMKVFDVNAVAANLEKMLRRLIGEDIELELVPGRDPGRVKGDPGQLEQVIMNLAVNARDAMPEGGRLTLSTSNVEADEAFVLRHVSVRPGSYVVLSVTDTGCGMDEETKSRLFEPFFTTKEPGKGTGLGLSTVYGIVRQSGGCIEVESETGRGTTFRIYLPRLAGEEDALPVQEAGRSRPAGGRETILLVEDEEVVRMLARKILSSNGYKVMDAGNGEEALRICRTVKGTIHLLLTDVVMPRMGGRELAEHLVLLRPKMKILYMSGYTDDAIVRHGVLDAGTAFLHKPFTADALVSMVRGVLDAPQALEAPLFRPAYLNGKGGTTFS